MRYAARMPHLVVSISGHGFGHVALTAPILNLLHQRLPQLRLTVRSNVPTTHLRSRIAAPFDHLPGDGDIGLVMNSALDIDLAASRAAYRAFHADWEARVDREAELLRELGADLVFSNVGYLPLAGAQHAGIANAALCSLNWADIYRHYFGDDDIHRQIRSCYTCADTFLRATPGMAMGDLPKLRPVAPIAASGRNRREELAGKLGLASGEKLVLISMGGIAWRLPIEHWPRIDGVRWLVQQKWQVDHPDAIAFETLALEFNDLLASCDALLCKPGYGSFIEASCNNIPVLFVNRGDWPEAPALVSWLQQHGRCREISRDALERGQLADALQALWRMPKLPPVHPTGVAEVADWLQQRLAQDKQPCADAFG